MNYKDFSNEEKTAFNSIENALIKLSNKSIRNIIKLIVWKWLK